MNAESKTKKNLMVMESTNSNFLAINSWMEKNGLLTKIPRLLYHVKCGNSIWSQVRFRLSSFLFEMIESNMCD